MSLKDWAWCLLPRMIPLLQKRPFASLFTEIPIVIPLNSNFSLSVWIFTTRQPQIALPILPQRRRQQAQSPAAPINKPGTPTQTSSALLPLVSTPMHLARLQITLKQQPHLNQLERYFDSQVIALHETLNLQQTVEQPIQTKAYKEETDVLCLTSKPQILPVPLMQWAVASKETPLDTTWDEPLFIKEVLKPSLIQIAMRWRRGSWQQTVTMTMKQIQIFLGFFVLKEEPSQTLIRVIYM